MGLCKCERRKITNLFCYEHRVNVCESCLMESHQRCVVKTYLQWLTNSEYEPICHLCQQSFASSSTQDTVRLTCLDVFHDQCLDEHGKRYPSTTAPAGFECPSCQTAIIPPDNKAGPIAEALKTFLLKTSWANSLVDGMSPIRSTSVKASSSASIPPFVNNNFDPATEILASRFLRSKNEVTPSSTAYSGTGPTTPEKHKVVHVGTLEGNTCGEPACKNFVRFILNCAIKTSSRFVRMSRKRLVLSSIAAACTITLLFLVNSASFGSSSDADQSFNVMMNPNVHVVKD